MDVFEGLPRGSLVIDTNILLLLIVGASGPERLGSHRRTRSLAAGPDDYHRVQEFVLAFRQLRITPTILAETSNLLGAAPSDRALLANMLQDWIEVYHPSLEVIPQWRGEYLRLGLADAATLHLAQHGHVVVTDDAVLHNRLYSAGLYSVNLAHLRSL